MSKVQENMRHLHFLCFLGLIGWLVVVRGYRHGLSEKMVRNFVTGCDNGSRQDGNACPVVDESLNPSPNSEEIGFCESSAGLLEEHVEEEVVDSMEFRESVAVVVQEWSVSVPATAEVIVLDIVHDFQIFVDFQDSSDTQQGVDFKLSVDSMGDHSTIPAYTVNYRVISLGPQTEILLTLIHSDNSQDNTTENHIIIIIIMAAAAAAAVAVVKALVRLSRRRDATARECRAVDKTQENGYHTQGFTLSGIQDKESRKRLKCEIIAGIKESQIARLTSLVFLENWKQISGGNIREGTLAQAAAVQHGLEERQETQEEEAVRRAYYVPDTAPEVASHAPARNRGVMEQMTSSLTCPDQPPYGAVTREKVSAAQQQTQDNCNDRKWRCDPPPAGGQPNRAPRVRLRGLAFVLVAAFVVVAVAVGVSKIRAKPTLHVTFPASVLTRKVRMFSDFPDLSQLSKNHSSLSLLSRLQLLDTQRCKDDLRSCKITVVCDSATDQSINCRCRHGFYFMDWQCHACTSQCPQDYYLVSSCSVSSDAVCKPCSVCGKTQYEAAQCNTNRDTICIDVSFPVGILPMNKSYLPDDGIEVSVGHSPNVFMERLINMEALETPMYVTNNQQSLDFVWPRLSGLDIAVSVAGVFLVPDYHDIEAVDDTALFHKLLEPTQNVKDYYNYVQNYYCRHPIPDYYSLQLEIMANRTSAAQVVRCDSQDDSLPRCPDMYKDGDRYLKWNINTACPNYKSTTKLTPLKDGPNSIVCTDETDILRKVFHGARPTTQEYMFPSWDCETHRRQCEQCLKSATCSAASTSSNESYLEDNQCCGIHCYTQTSCKKTFSPECPTPVVECATGEVNIFSLFPHFDSMDRQFTCHVKYALPVQLYSISYSVRAAAINFNTTPQYFVVTPNSRSDHERRLSMFDFMSALHDTRMKIEDELILLGDHIELTHYHDSLMKPYTVRELKTPADLNKRKSFTQNYASKSSYIQFERPFLYSSLTWYKDGCYKNMSKIYPNQTIYREDFIPVMARKNIIELEPNKALFKNREYSYQLYHRDRAPYIKFYVEKGKSVLQYLQGTSVKGKLEANSLYGRVSWHHDSSTWKLVFSATQDQCPSVISIKIFTQLMTGCAGHFDLLINCPREFTVTFNFSTGMSDLPDIFILQVNDSSTSHHMVLSSVYPPMFVDEIASKHSTHLKEKLSANDDKNGAYSIWIPVLLIVIITLVLAVIIFISHKCINSRVRKVDVSAKVSSEDKAVAWNNQGEQVHQTAPTSEVKRRPKCFIVLFVILYFIYSAVFTFSLTFYVIYLTNSAMWSNLTNSEQLGRELQNQVNKSLLEIQKFEEMERLRLFTSYQERRKACIYHLENENRKLLLDYESIARKQIDAIFVKNGTLHYFTSQIQKQNVSAFIQQINNFVSDCNKTLLSIVDRFQANYYQFIRNTANNDWLKVPRQIFLHQDGEDPNLKYLSSTQVKQFASWLEIDKAEELFAVKENVFGRLYSIPVPHISALDVTFPSVHSHLQFRLPRFDFDSSSQVYSVLEPLFAESSNNSSNSTLATARSLLGTRAKRDEEVFGLSGNLRHNLDSHDSSDIPALLGIPNDKQDNSKVKSRSRIRNDAGYEAMPYTQEETYQANLRTQNANFESNHQLQNNNFETNSHAQGANYESNPHTHGANYQTELQSQDANFGTHPQTQDASYKTNPRMQDANYLTDLQPQGTNYLTDQQSQGANIGTNPQQQDTIYETNPNAEDKPTHKIAQDIEKHQRLNSSFTETKNPASLVITEHQQPQGEPLTSNSHSAHDDESHSKNNKFYILIAVFLLLDVVLWVYRMSWLSNQLYAARHGYADRIPTDEACKQVLEIQTAYHLPAFENPHDESSGYYVDGKEQLYGSEKDHEITFLQTLPTPKSKDDILQKIWSEKMNKAEDRAVVRMRKCFIVRWYGDLRIILNRLCLSQLVWQGSVTFLAIAFICVFMFCVDYWLTPDNFRTLVGGQSAAADVQWYLDTSDRYLHGLAHQLTAELHHMKRLCDSEVDLLTEMFFRTVSLQTSLFTTTLQGLCREARGKNCDKILTYQSTGGRIVGCNFLPLQAQTFHDLSLSHMEAIVAKEVTPLVNLSHHMLSLSASVVISLLCFRLLCQATASTVRHFLLLTGQLPRVRVYQSEEPQMTSSGPVNTTMQRSQSWVDSCESGVYLGEVDDANKEENR